jgi:O-antigen ligase
MAIPLCAGYLIARRPGRLRQDFRPWRVRIASALDGRAIWLMTVTGLMMVALFASLSRSGLVGLAAVLIVGWAGARWRPQSQRHYWVLLALVLLSAAVLLWGDLPALLARLDSTQALEPRDRIAIWRDTWSLVRDHWLAGVGAGAYERAMLLYQQTDRSYYDNQAHNQFLQVAADGGVLLAVPVLVACALLMKTGLERLRHDRTGMYWIRLGALAGLSGVAVQSLWETGLRAPGNAILSAVLAAILIHEPIATNHPDRSGP